MVKCAAVSELFLCVDPLKKKNKCALCGLFISGGHLRRMLCHFLPDSSDGSVKACSKLSIVRPNILSQMELCLNELNDEQQRRKSKRKRVDDVKVSKFQSALKLKSNDVKSFDKKEMNLAFARMVIMSMCRSGFMDSYFTKHFFSYYLNYQIPSRRNLYRNLLDEPHEDTKAKVEAKLNLDDPDILLTLTMDAWTAPNGDHLRNYVAVTDGGLDLMITAEDVGQVSQTGAEIGNSSLAVLESLGQQHFSSVVTDNAANETTSWDVITSKYPEILCTGCACHASSLLFKDVMQHQWASKILNEATTLAKFIKGHTWTNLELKRRTKADGRQRSVVLHAATRFAGSYYTMNRLLDVRGPVREMVVSTQFEDKKYDNQGDIQRLVQRVSFWTDLTSLVAFMRPLKKFIKLLDHSHHTTHLVVPGLETLREEWDTLKGTVPVGRDGRYVTVVITTHPRNGRNYGRNGRNYDGRAYVRTDNARTYVRTYGERTYVQEVRRHVLTEKK